MKKILVPLLITVVIGIYGYDLWLLLSLSGGGSESNKKIVNPSIVVAGIAPNKCHFTSVKRSPFEPYTPKPKKTVVKSAPKKKVKPKVEVQAPRIKINGIMWNPNKPIVMLKLPNGTTKMVKVGDEVMGRIVIKQIEKKRIQVLYKEQLFWIEK